MWQGWREEQNDSVTFILFGMISKFLLKLLKSIRMRKKGMLHWKKSFQTLYKLLVILKNSKIIISIIKKKKLNATNKPTASLIFLLC